MLFYQGDSVSQGLFFSCALSHNHNMSRFNSWVAGARECFLPKDEDHHILQSDLNTVFTCMVHNLANEI